MSSACAMTPDAMRVLTPDMLASMPASMRRPLYPRHAGAIGVAHIGVGAFHRCHLAEYADDLLRTGAGAWGIVGINLRPPRLADLLEPQDGLYTRTLLDNSSARTEVIGAIMRVVDVDDAASAQRAVETLASPMIRVATMTLTEKGYCHVPATGVIDWTNPELAHDRANPMAPRTALGLLALALERRRTSDAGGMSLASCDNIPANGALLRGVLTDFCGAANAPLARWIEREVAFPSTMVDRIVPATTPADLERAAEATGLIDRAAVVGEPFRQWVIEDRFARERPPWDMAGAQFVADVTAYEHIKMRVLNAAQSTLSHLGALAGLNFSFEAAADPALARFVRAMLEGETFSTLANLGDMPIGPYLETSMARIRNTAIRHSCHQIGTDGSQKIVQRLLNPLRERRAAGRSTALLTLGVAAWIAYVLGGCERFGRRWTAHDPWSAALMSEGDRPGADFTDIARSVLAIAPIFGGDLADAPMAARIGAHLKGLLAGDPRAYALAAIEEARA
jgi:fructuronate reductase